MKSGISLFHVGIYRVLNLVEQVDFYKEYYREPLSVYLSRIAEGKVGLVFAVMYLYVSTSWFNVGTKRFRKGIELSGIRRSHMNESKYK